MKYDDFVGQVQHRARLGTQGEAVRAIRATLETLSERVVTGQAENLAAQLPQEIGYYLRQSEGTDRFSLDEFFQRVASRADIDLPDAAHQARSVVSVVREVVTQSAFENVQTQLSNEFEPLFTSGSEGEMDA